MASVLIVTRNVGSEGLYSSLELEKTLGEVPKTIVKVNERANKISSNDEAYLHINRISFKVCLYAAKDGIISC
jgi:hypothetical protein